MSFVVRADQVANREAVGGKAHTLGVLRPALPEIPDWFVVRPEAFAATLGAERAQAVAEGRAEAGGVELGVGLRAEIRAALRDLCPDGAPVAVRSSAVEEDSAEASFAGQLESFLDVAHEDVPARVVDVWRSGFSPRVRAYRREQGLPGPPRAPAVLVQRMTRAQVSGVAFSRDPVSGDPAACIVCATSGLGDRLVSGDVEGDTFRVVGDEVVAERVCTARPVLDGQQVRAVAALARRAESLLGRPQDVEWAITDGRLVLLQSRPITNLAAPCADDDAGDVLLWDDSNIVESYSGITSPLTFTFARHAYEGVYRQFMVHLGVPRAVIAAHAALLGAMLGRVQGRVYYNLLAWYRMLAVLPGFHRNRRYLDQMLGIDAALPRDLLDRVAPPRRRGLARLGAAFAIVRSSLAIAWNRLILRRRIVRFHSRVDAALATPVSRVATMRLDELAAHYLAIERALIHKWDAPVLNDFFCMTLVGLSRRVLRAWGGRAGERLHAELMQTGGHVISTEPARRIREMAALVAGDAALCAALASPDWRDAAASHPPLRAALDEYLEIFGDRCVQELKLESPTLYDDPATLVRTIGHLAARGDAPPPPERRDALPELRRVLHGRPVRRLLARLLLRQARRHVHDRENLRFERTRVFGRVRRVFVEMGRRLVESGHLDDVAQVFELEMSELLGAVDGTLTTADLRGLAEVRRRDAERWRAQPDPPHRFLTRGAVIVAALRPLTRSRDRGEGTAGAERRGLGCSPGTAVGRARVVDDPQGQSLEPGAVLVARHTDPGWVLLFTGAAAIVVERGSLLSHSAIVARELGIPAVVSVPGVMEWLRDGDRVEVDGTRGSVRRIDDD